MMNRVTRPTCIGARAKNVEIQVDSHILTIRVDLTQEGVGPSSSKMTIVASIEGSIDVPGLQGRAQLAGSHGGLNWPMCLSLKEGTLLLPVPYNGGCVS